LGSVEFVVRLDDVVVAIEVKSGRERGALAGLAAFDTAFSPRRKLLVGADGITLEDFLASPVRHWVRG
jgi:hypothetical protein